MVEATLSAHLGSRRDHEGDVPHPGRGVAGEDVILGHALPLAQAAGQVAPSPAVARPDLVSDYRTVYTLKMAAVVSTPQGAFIWQAEPHRSLNSCLQTCHRAVT